ncbi:MAG: hypothetical protein ACK5JU_04975 [Bacteroidales bacterium]
MGKKSQFIQDVESYAEKISERLLETKEGGLIVIADDRTASYFHCLATGAQRKAMIKELMKSEEMVLTLHEVLGEEILGLSNDKTNQDEEN